MNFESTRYFYFQVNYRVMVSVRIRLKNRFLYDKLTYRWADTDMHLALDHFLGRGERELMIYVHGIYNPIFVSINLQGNSNMKICFVLIAENRTCFDCTTVSEKCLIRNSSPFRGLLVVLFIFHHTRCILSLKSIVSCHFGCRG